jgi:hypothetical protein
MVFGEFPMEVAGKTGTEEGGFGAESAAPAAKQILEAYFRHAIEREGEEAEEREASEAGGEVE